MIAAAEPPEPLGGPSEVTAAVLVASSTEAVGSAAAVTASAVSVAREKSPGMVRAQSPLRQPRSSRYLKAATLGHE